MGSDFTIGDIPVGLVVNRQFSIPFQKPEFKAASAHHDRLAERPPYKAHGRNGHTLSRALIQEMPHSGRNRAQACHDAT